jgi:TonB C terminal
MPITIAFGATQNEAAPVERSEPAVKGGETVTLDIPSQPLASALDRYGDVTGHEVLYDTALAEGRRSSPVKGVFAPEMALRKLLDGTGLSASFLPDESFVLVPTPPTSRQAASNAAPTVVQQQYYARIQTSLRDAFCENGHARAGDYRVAVKFWIDPSGTVSREERLGSAGRPDLDSGIDETLRGLQIGAPPPDGFLQPVLIMIVPQGRNVTMGCDPGGTGLRQAGAEP